MRITLTLDPDLAHKFEREASSGRGSFHEVVNKALHIGLGLNPLFNRTAFRIIAHESGYQSVVDPLEVEPAR